MSRIIGVVCDNCGGLDVEVDPGLDINEDSFPRNGWISLTEWDTDEESRPGPELNVCGTSCLKEFAHKVHVDEEHEGHTHSHDEN